MDPFTISTGIRGFLSLAIELVDILTEYTNTVKPAAIPSDARKLLTEVASLTQVLKQLTDFLKKPEHDIDFRETSVLCSIVEICDVRIKNLHSKLDKFQSIGKTQGQWSWPFTKQECLDIAQTLQHCAETIQLSLTISNGELLSRTSQDLMTALTERKQQCDSMLALLQVIPPQLQQMQNNINAVLQSVPIIDSVALDLREVKNALLQLQHQKDAARLHTIQKLLSPLEPQKRHNDIKSKRIDNTGEWIFETEAYQAWIANTTPEDSILFLHGMPGAGKTFLSSMMIDQLCANTAKAPKSGVTFLYCDYRDQINQNIVNIIGSICNQLLNLLNREELDTICIQIEEQHEKNHHLSREFIQNTLHSMCKMFDQVFICLDAIDELKTETRTALMKSFQELMNMSNYSSTDTSGGIFLYFAARSHVKEMVTQTLGNQVHSLTITANCYDIQKYILHQLQIDPHPKLMNDDLRQQLLTKIPKSSQGMFLLSALHIQMILQELTIAERKAAIFKLPTDLYTAFHKSLERITNSPGPVRKLGMKVLMWMHFAYRQLHLEEIVHALAVKDGATDLDLDNIPLEETILYCCNGLVVIDHETSSIRFVHFSLQEFFRLHSADYFPDGHKEIAHTCLIYLNFTPLLVHCTETEALIELSESYHLLQYAAGQWGRHAFQQFDDTSKPLTLQLLTLEKPPPAVQFCFWEWMQHSNVSPYRSWNGQLSWCCEMKTNDGIYVAAAFGLRSILGDLLTTPKREGLNRIIALVEVLTRHSFQQYFGYLKQTPLSVAAARGHSDVVSLLLQQHDINVNLRDTVFHETSLLLCARRGNQDIVRLLLEHPNIDLKTGEPFLLWAIRNGHEGVVRLILEHPNAIYWNVKQLLHSAVDNGHEGIVRLLLKHPKIKVNARDRYQEYLLDCAASAASNGHEGLVRLLLEHPDITVIASDRYQQGLLNCAVSAASNGHLGLVRLLLEHPDITINARDRYQQELLQCAISNGHGDVVRLLLGQPNIDVNARNEQEKTPLFFAASYGDEHVVRILLEHPDIDVNASNLHQRTPLSCAASEGYGDVVCLLLEHPNIDVNASDEDEETPLSYAASEGHDRAVRLLLEHPNIDVNASDQHGQSPLLYATRKGYERTVRLLLEHPSIDVNASNKYQETPLSNAASQGHEVVVRLLLEDPIVDVNASDQYGQTPLSYAARKGHEAIVRLLLGHPNIDINATDEDEQTPLSRAASKGHEVVVRLLLEHRNVDINLGSPLGWAAAFCYENIVRLLLEHPDIDVNTTNANGETPLSLALHAHLSTNPDQDTCPRLEENDMIVRLLLERPDIKVNTVNKAGRTPLSNAISTGQGRIARLLRQHPNTNLRDAPVVACVGSENRSDRRS